MNSWTHYPQVFIEQGNSPNVIIRFVGKIKFSSIWKKVWLSLIVLFYELCLESPFSHVEKCKISNCKSLNQSRDNNKSESRSRPRPQESNLGMLSRTSLFCTFAVDNGAVFLLSHLHLPLAQSVWKLPDFGPFGHHYGTLSHISLWNLLCLLVPTLLAGFLLEHGGRLICHRHHRPIHPWIPRWEEQQEKVRTILLLGYLWNSTNPALDFSASRGLW